MKLALFHVWEDARVWAQCSVSFEMHLNYLGPVFFFSTLNSTQGTPVVGGGEGAAVADGLMA